MLACNQQSCNIMAVISLVEIKYDGTVCKSRDGKLHFLTPGVG